VHGPRGLRGEFKVEPLTDFPERFAVGAQLYVEGRAYTVALSRNGPTGLLLQLEGVTTRERAAELRGRYLELPEAELAELEDQEYYRFEIVGLEVVDTSGASLGRVFEVMETGANDVYVVRDHESELLVPAIDTVVQEIDVPGGRMVIEVLEGMERRPLKKPTRRRPPSRGP
jgi:16S rRNA processing protein RimM